MAAPEGFCWLCNRFGKLTKEHIPPEAAFNDCPLLLLKMDERSNRQLGWVEQDRFSSGLYFRSLCAQCNNRYGSIYGESYVHLVRRVAERIGDVHDFHRISILDVKRPLRILKQIMLQFVTANGAGFVQANDWVAPFIRNKTNQDIPRDIAIYLFASNRRGSRKSGVSTHMELRTGVQRLVAEFSFWPLGTVLSWGEISDDRLTPVHHWSQFRFDYEGSVDLHLSVNPVTSDYPLDFRNEQQIIKGRTEDVDVKRPSEESSKEMINKAIARSGTNEKDWFFSGHPKTVNKITDR